MAPEKDGELSRDEPIGEDKKDIDDHQLVVDETDDNGNHAYGCFSWKPSFLQFLSSGSFFCALLCMVVASDAFNSGTFGSAVTSLEIRYQLPSSQLGFINSMYELASLVLVLFVVYYGGKPTSDRPLWIGLGSILMAIGAMVALLPQFIFGNYIPLIDSSGGNDNTTTATCSAGGNESDYCSSNGDNTDGNSNRSAFIFIICGQIIVGLGWTPVMSLGMSYIDDNVKTTTSAMHIGYVQSMFGFGRIAGFLIGGVTVRKWVDFYRDDPDNYGVTPQDPQWVGAWWLGLIIASVSYFISGLPMIGFPRSLPKNYDETHDDFMGHSKRERSNRNGSVEKTVKPKSKKKAAFESIKDMPGKFWETCKNPLYLVINMAFVTEFAAQIGLNIFFPKYLETEFGLTSSKANLITGATLVPAAALGSIVGGVIVKKFKTKAEGSCKIALVLSVVAMFLLLVTFGVGCRTIPTAGVTTLYSDQSPGTSLSSSSTCNEQCGCNNDIYSPVCGDDGITYVSACHAGCLLEHDNGTFGDCSCINGDNGEDSAIHGNCGNNCKTLIPFLIISFLVVVISGAEEIPQTLIAMRCVKQDSKAIALGIRAIMMRLLGAIPAPLIYGVMIDTACRLWQTECGKQGSCYVYDLAAFRYAYLGVNFIFKVLTVLFYILSLWLIRRQRLRNQNCARLDDDEEEA